MTFLFSIVAGAIGGAIGLAFVNRARGRKARRGVFLSGVRVLNGGQAGIVTKEWMVGEWTISEAELHHERVIVRPLSIVRGSRRVAALKESIGGGETTTVFTLRTATGELEWSMMARFESLALSSLDVPEV